MGEKAGLVALTQLADGHYLMMVTGGSNEKLQFYRSTLTDLMNDTLSWVPLDAWQADPLFQTDPQEPEFLCYPGSVRWGSRCLSPDEVQSGAQLAHHGRRQREPAPDAPVHSPRAASTAHCFLRAARGRIWGDDFMDLYRLECDTPLCLPGGQVRLAHVSTRHMISNPSFGGDRLANFAAASTFYVSPSQELLLYATEHDNDGPSGTVKMGEWRHRQHGP